MGATGGTARTEATGRGRGAPGRVCVGAVTGARGLKGEVRIKSFTADPEAIAAYGPVTDKAGKRRFAIRVTGRVKGALTARLDGIDDRDAAEALRGTELYVPRTALPAPEAGSWYHADLVGLRVETPDGRELGTVKAVHNFGAGDVIEVTGGASGGVMLPFTDSAVMAIDVAAGRMVATPPSELTAGDGAEKE